MADPVDEEVTRRSVDDLVRNAREAVVLRPGDKVLVRFGHQLDDSQLADARDLFSRYLPGVDVVLVRAEQVEVVRSADG